MPDDSALVNRLSFFAEHDDADGVRGVLAECPSAALALDSLGRTALMVAASHACESAFFALLPRSDPLQVSDEGTTALQFAVKMNYSQTREPSAACVRALLESAHERSHLGDALYHAGSGAASRETIALFFASPLNQPSERATWLAAAGCAGSGKIEALAFLLPRVDPLWKNEGGHTLLSLAASASQPRSVELLLPVSDLAALTGAGETALLCAAASKWSEPADATRCVELLLPVCDPRSCSHKGQTPLMAAAEAGNCGSVRLLLPLSDPAARDDNGITALMCAARHPSWRGTECVQILLGFCDPDARDGSARKALGWALGAANEESAWLLAARANLSDRDGEGRTELAAAAFSCSLLGTLASGHWRKRWAALDRLSSLASAADIEAIAPLAPSKDLIPRIFARFEALALSRQTLTANRAADAPCGDSEGAGALASGARRKASRI